jgi:hypothetical protein
VRHRCNSDSFTEDEFDRNRKWFYPMPSEWGDPESPDPMLARVWREGGAGAISLLPVLGQYAHWRFRGNAVLSKEKLARLAGVDPATVAKAGKALDRLGLATPSTGLYQGKRVTTWELKPSLAVARPGGRLARNYFHFSAAVVHGGHWAKLTKVQRAIYLAVGAKSRLIKHWKDVANHFRAVMPKDVSLADVRLAHEYGNDIGGVRVTHLSYAELQRLTGIGVSALKEAVRLLKHPANWTGSLNDPSALRYSPLAVYPTFDGYSLLYHLRDHVPHWPWNIVNGEAHEGVAVHGEADWFEEPGD